MTAATRRRLVRIRNTAPAVLWLAGMVALGLSMILWAWQLGVTRP